MIYPANLNLAITNMARSVSAAARSHEKSFSKISSGSKLEDPGSDNVSTAVSLKYRNSHAVIGAVEKGLTNALSYLTAQAEGLQHMSSRLNRMSELVSQMQDASKTGDEKESYISEFNQLRAEIVGLQAEQFNGRSLYYVQGDQESLTVQAGTSGNQALTLSQPDFSQQAGWLTLLGFEPPYTGISGISDTAANLSDPAVLGGLSFFDGLSQEIAGMIATNAAQQSQVQVSVSTVRERRVASSAALSQVSDTDVAQELTRLNRTKLLMESGSLMMTQATVAASSVLKLLR